jgi:hypothetical protein
LTLETAVYSALVVLCAYWVRGMASFGSGLVAVPLLTLPVTLVVPVVVALDYLGSASQGIKNVGQELRSGPASAWNEWAELSRGSPTVKIRRAGAAA